MKRITLALGLCLVCSIAISSQQSDTRASGETSSQTTAMANGAGKTINLDSGTSLSGQLQNSIDVRHAKVGDEVLLKTTKAIKSGGQTVVNKGSRLVGHITEVAQKTKSNGDSRIGILFDRLEQGTLQTPITASITSITSAATNAQVGNDDMFANSSAGSSTRTSSSAGPSSSAGTGGLLGGVGNAVGSTTSTVGNVVGNTTSAVGTTVNSTTNTVGNTTNGVGRSLGGIQISQSSSTTVEGSSVLSLQGGNLRLEKGTNFNLVLTQSTSAGTSRNP
ncbi:MAG TPA: hypothetical protein VLL54_21105 [Pyrinomonadaceae bacterium]|nr:hypothetical protein [Pyrinomonadaceae bacterium]